MVKKITVLMVLILCFGSISGQHVFSVEGDKTLLNGEVFQAIGFRCSNALLSEGTTKQLISQLDTFKSYGLNTISVFLMGSRYSNINGFNLDGTLNDVYSERLGRIITACDQRGMVVLLGLLYWGSQMSAEQNAYYQSWTQKEVNLTMRNTVQWLKKNRFRNVLIDPDNEGMAQRGAGFDIAEMICVGKKEHPEVVIAYNGRGYPPPCADLPVHFGERVASMPYIESEGTPSQYWGEYSKERGLSEYINVGVYTEGKKAEQLAKTKAILERGDGYLFASTWLQNVPPNYNSGGEGSACDPGIKWWLDFVKNWKESR
jgi:hypothetical protein